MSPPEPGTYWIYSCVRNEMDKKLAMTFNSEGKPVTVTPLDVSDSSQRWMIENYHDLQYVIPASHKDLKANYGETINTIGGDGHPCWIISPENDGYM
ncbi:hypothetical protein FRC09_014989 [Ceratobasidium sp. 395]|nr:hypothetical protein FRC09_014989 [Ceratobasidium sp. 395]